MRAIYKGRIIHLDQLKHRADKFDMICTSLSRIYRWGGLQTNTITVAAHSVLCLWALKDLFKGTTPDLQYNTLLHEVEEAFGVGDIITEVKHAIFPDRTHYDAFKDIMAEQFNLDMLNDYRIKYVDTLVAMAEALAFLERPENIYDLFVGQVKAKEFAFKNLKYLEDLSETIKKDIILLSDPKATKGLMLQELRALNFGVRLGTKQ